MMRPGQMRDSVTFKTKLSTDDGLGGRVETWVEKWSCACKYTPQRGGEESEGDRTVARGKAVLQIRFSAAGDTITEDDIAVVKGVEHTIKHIENFDRRNRVIEMVLERGVNL